MAFVKRDVKDRAVEHPRRYRLIQVEPGIFDLEPITGEVIEPGTLINKAYLQPIEEAIEDIEDGTTVVQNAYSANNAVISDRATKLATPRNINGVPFDGTQPITIVDNTKAPTNHASTGTGHGVGTGSNYGHVKLSDSTGSTSGVSGGTAATPAAVKVVKDLTDGKQNKYVFLRTLSMNIATTREVAIPTGDFNNYNQFIYVVRGTINASGAGGSGRYVDVGIGRLNSVLLRFCRRDYTQDVPLVATLNASAPIYIKDGHLHFMLYASGTNSEVSVNNAYFALSYQYSNDPITLSGMLYLDIYGIETI